MARRTTVKKSVAWPAVIAVALPCLIAGLMYSGLKSGGYLDGDSKNTAVDDRLELRVQKDKKVNELVNLNFHIEPGMPGFKLRLVGKSESPREVSVSPDQQNAKLKVPLAMLSGGRIVVETGPSWFKKQKYEFPLPDGTAQNKDLPFSIWAGDVPEGGFRVTLIHNGKILHDVE